MAPRGDETKESYGRRKEKERLKAQAASKAGAHGRSADATGRAANWLKRETPFMCDIRFRNDLPEVPCDPKMLVSQPNPKALAAFHLTTLETGPWRGMPVEADLGVPVSVFDPSPYCVPQMAQPLHPDDEALLEGEGHLSSVGTSPGHPRSRGRVVGDKKELSWLMRTTYITNDLAPSPAKAAQVRKRDHEEEEEQDEVQRQIDHIQASFEAAKQFPRHQKNPNLQPVEIMPVLPDEDLWPNEYVQLVFDADPTAGMSQLSNLTPAQRRSCAVNSVTKSYRMTVDGVNTGFLALMVPRQPPQLDNPPPEREPMEVQWVREYSYEVHQQEADRDFAFILPPPHDPATDASTSATGREVRYVAMDHKLVAKGMGARQQAQKLAATFSKPSKITVGWRAYTDTEEDTRAAKKQQLMPIMGDEGLFDEDDDDNAVAERAPADQQTGGVEA